MKHLSNDMRIAIAFAAVVFAAGLVAPSAKADEWNKRTVLTVNEPIQIDEALLQPGQYVLKLYNSNSNRHIVEIFNHKENHIIATVIAIPAERLTPTGETQFTFWETPAGTPKAMRDWFYPGDLIGQEFRYRPRQLAMAKPQPAPQQVAQEAPPPPPAPQPEEVAPPEQAPEEAPAPEEQPPAPAPAPPAQLPKTASPYPLIGLSGLALIALAGLLRLRRLPLR
jgi:LPXTG-motif cell wall-anchored protein